MSAAAMQRTSARPGGQLATNLHDRLASVPLPTLQFDALAVPLGLMVRSRSFGPAQIPRPRARRLEPWGRPILRDGRYATIAFPGSARTCALLRMRRIHGKKCKWPGRAPAIAMLDAWPCALSP